MLGFFWQILIGTLTTLELAITSLVLGMLVGMVFTFLEMSHNNLLKVFIRSIIFILRGLPEILILFFIYFGITRLLSELSGRYIEISPFMAGTIALSLLFGAYASQVFRGALIAIPAGQIAGAKALGFNKRQIFFRIAWPQAWRYALPGLGNLWLILLKDTAIVMLIGLSDLMNYAKLAARTMHEPFIFYLFAAGIYLVITLVSQKVIHFYTRKVNLGVMHHE